MMKYLNLIFLAILLMAGQLVSAQNLKADIKGTVLDTANLPLNGATVVLLNATDSVLVKFGLSNTQGKFFFRKVESGNYLLQITYLGLGKYSEEISFDAANGDLILEAVSLQMPDMTLGEVTIEGERTPIVIRGDTIEYNADAFQTQPNAVVEDLLRKLPGVEVERDGTVKAQGEQVQRVFVDGKEFFGDDPKMATKNLPADAVDKVQVYDKASEMAEFTGIDDGREQKAINLELKEGKKQGLFGKLMAGYGTEERFEAKGNINRFSDKMQFSAIGMGNNINEQGFSMQDYINFMGGLRSMMSGGGGVRIAIDLDEGGGMGGPGGGAGITTSAGGGINFNYDIGKKTKFHSSYFYNYLNTRNESEIYAAELSG